MKKTLAAIVAITMLGGSSLAFAQSSTDNGSMNRMTTGRASATEDNNNNPGTTAGTPNHSVPANSANTGTSNLFNSAK